MAATTIPSRDGRDRAPQRPLAAHRPAGRHRHGVQFYEDDAFLGDAVARFLDAGLAVGEPALVLATEAHRTAIATALAARGVAVDAVRARGTLTMLDARETLATFMEGGLPDAARFRAVVGSLVEAAGGPGPRAMVRAYGEMVDLLWRDGNPGAALRLEELWNDLATTHAFTLLCTYAMDGFAGAEHADGFAAICGAHSHVLPTERYAAHGDDDRPAEIAILQQRARALETEIRRRQALERQLLDAMAAIREREEELRDVLDNAAEGIHWVTADGTIKWVNQAELAMLGYPADEYVGHHIAEFHVDAPVIADMLARLARGETLTDYEARLRRKDGSIRHVRVNSNVRWRDGQFVHTRCFTRDVTELKRAATERERLLLRERAARAEAERAKAAAERAKVAAERARVAAEQANRAKSEFLAVMSHELRTPLNAIGGYAELMGLGLHGPVSPQQQEALDRIQRSQRHLLGLINQVLNYARVETGSLRYDIAEVPLDEVLRTTEALLAPQLREKGLRYLYAGCDPAETARADAEKVQQIMVNLLSNAVKFTDRGGRIEVACEVRDAWATVRVRDTGIGIPAEKLDAIFDPFVQVDTRYTRSRDGTGLGLAISRDLARAMGGDLTAESVPGEGSTFALVLPRGERAAAAVAGAGAPAA